MADVLNLPAGAVQAAQRQFLYLFLVGAFPIVSPGNAFTRADYIEAMCFALQKVAEGKTLRLIISVAPRHLKSLCASIVLPAFILGRNPTREIMVVSYGGDLARGHAETFRRLVQSDFYRALFPNVAPDRRSTGWDNIQTVQGGGRRAMSLMGPMTGFGADLIVLDDLIKAGDANYATMRDRVRTQFDEAIYSRLNDKRTGAIISVAQRLNADDITVHLLEKGGFDHLLLPSIAPARIELPLHGGRRFVREPGDVLNPGREPNEALDRIRQEIGTRAFNAQYLQDPDLADGQYLRLEDLHLVDSLPDLDLFTRRIQSWDTAAKDGPASAYSVCVTAGWHREEERWYLLDIYRDRPGNSALKDRVIGLRQHWQAERVLIEDAAMGSALLSDLRKERCTWAQKVTATEGKLERFLPATDWLKAGFLIIPTDQPWFDAFRRELLAFPNHRYLDQVDALVQFLHWAKHKARVLLDTDPSTGRRLGTHRRVANRRQ
ncbi:MAG: phage terminase large subunit [Rhodobacteraceae bacterium]|nr:phage terminase large subunit [Paracoccaceae bacterium]